MKQKAPSIQSAIKTLYGALQVLKENDGHLKWSEIIRHLENKLEFTEWENTISEKTGFKRWTAILSFYSVTASKAGMIRKHEGEWHLTEEGEQSLEKLSPDEFMDLIIKKYKIWEQSREKESVLESNNEDVIQESNLEQIESRAMESILEYLHKKTPYEFQDIVAALLRGMGYYIAFVASKGRDGGVDIIAYQDPLGIKNPKVKVQVKHYSKENKIQVPDIRSLVGLLHKDNEIGLFVTSGQFTSESERFARESHVHIQLIDETKFIALWKEFYPKLSDEDKNLLPLKTMYFLGSNE